MKMAARTKNSLIIHFFIGLDGFPKGTWSVYFSGILLLKFSDYSVRWVKSFEMSPAKVFILYNNSCTSCG